MLTIAQAAKKLRVTRQAVYVAISKTKKIKAEKVKGRFLIAPEELDNYKRIKFSRKYSVFSGKPLYETEKGEISVNDAAKMFRISAQRLYYLLRIGKIPSTRKNSAYILQLKDVEKSLENYKKRGYFSWK